MLNFGGTGNLFKQENIFTESWLVRFYTFLTVLVEFFKMILWPARLHMEKGTVLPIYTSFGYAPVLVGFCIFACLVGGAFFCFQRTLSVVENNDNAEGHLSQDPAWPPILLFGMVWFFFGLIPISNIFIPISTIMEDSWLYALIIGPVLIFSWGFVYLFFQDTYLRIRLQRLSPMNILK